MTGPLDMQISFDGVALSDQVAAAAASITSVRAALLAANGSTQLLDDVFASVGVDLLDLSDRGLAERSGRTADGATVLHGFKVEPTDRYLELVAALGRDGDAHSIRVRHGWPILSVGDRTPTVTEAAAPGNRAAVEVRA